MASATDSALNWYSRRHAPEMLRIGVGVSIVGPRSANDERRWDDEGVTVFPSYRRGSLFSLFQAFRGVVRANNRVVHVQHELFAFGNLANAVLFPLLLWCLRLRGHRLLTTVHGIIPLSKMSDSFVRKNRIPGNVFTARLLWRVLIALISRLSHKVHVHEQFLCDLLESEYGVPPSRIVTIPLGVEPVLPRIGKGDARRALGLPGDAEVALFFGYLSAYKGIDYLFSELPNMLASRPRLHMVIAGDVPHRLLGSINPGNIVASLPTGSDRVHFLGFIPDELRQNVFGAADVLLLPHTIAMSSSGPLALAAGYDVPVLISRVLRCALPEAQISFDHKPNELVRAINQFFDDARARVLSYEVLERLRISRSWSTVAHSLCYVYAELGDHSGVLQAP